MLCVLPLLKTWHTSEHSMWPMACSSGLKPVAGFVAAPDALVAAFALLGGRRPLAGGFSALLPADANFLPLAAFPDAFR
jgi:hypothetical protein